jgi:hypothetical protein
LPPIRTPGGNFSRCRGLSRLSRRQAGVRAGSARGPPRVGSRRGVLPPLVARRRPKYRTRLPRHTRASAPSRYRATEGHCRIPRRLAPSAWVPPAPRPGST